MSQKYRVGIIGFAHMHINSVAAQFGNHPQVEMVACADTVPANPELRDAPYTRGWNVENALSNIGVPKVYEDYQEMLEVETFDIVICCSENATHADVVEACAAARVNVCVEKPMASSLSHALRMVRACQSAGTKMVINWPATWSPGIRKAKELIDQGAIGQVIQVKWRGGHTGPLGPGATHAGVQESADQMTGAELGATWWHQVKTGGGAMLDYCCYGSMLARWYIGQQALSATGMRANLNSQWGVADDNAAMIVRFPNALGLFEGSWTTLAHGVPTGPIVYGVTGTLILDNQGVRIERGQDQTSIHQHDSLPEGRQQISEEFIHHLETGEPLHQTLEMMFNLEIMAILDAGVRSTSSGKLEMVNSPAWQIG